MKKFVLTTLFAGAFCWINAQSVLTENFEAGTTIPSGWTQSTLATDGGWKFNVNTVVQSASFAIPAHTKMACTNDDACNCDKSNDLLKSTSFSLATVSSAFLKFDSYFLHGSYGGFTETAKVVSSIDGGATWNDLYTLPGFGGWNTEYVSLSSLVGQSNVMIGFKYNDGTGWEFGWAIDNFDVFTPLAADVAFTAVTPVTGSGTAYGAVGGNVTIGGTITNNGASTISSFTVKYSDGTNTYSDTKTGLNITSFSTYSFTHNTAYSVPSLGSHPLQVWVEYTGDLDHTNDTLATAIEGVPFLPAHKMVFEEGTGTWCGWCVRGIVYMDSMATVHPNDAILIGVHNADPMVYAAYDAGVGTLISGYPSVLSNRNDVIDPTDMFTSYNEHISDFGFADLAVNCLYNQSTGVANVNVDAHFAVDLTGPYRLAVVFTEDSLYGTSSTWAQHNYYSYQSQNLPLTGQGINYQALPQIIPAVQMHFDHVARTILGTFTGTASSLPSTIVANNTYSYGFSYTVPVAYHINKMHCYAVLIDITNNRILNGNTGIINVTTGINETSSGINEMLVYPNPAKNQLTVAGTFEGAKNVKVTMNDVAGREVTAFEQKQVTGMTKTIDVSNMAKGTYIISIYADGSVMRKKVTIE